MSVSDKIAAEKKQALAKFDVNKYAINTSSYPKDLMGAGSAYGNNYVIFFINVNIDSKLLKGVDGKSGGLEILDDADYNSTQSIRGTALGQDLGRATIFAAGASSMAIKGSIAGGGAAAAKGAGLKGVVGAGVGGALAAAAPGAIGLGAVAALSASTNRSMKRLKQAIALHIPNQLNVRYGTQWTEDDTATALLAPLMAEAAIKAAGNLAIGSGGDAGQRIADGGAGLAALGLSGAGGMNSGLASVATGLAFNPRKEQLFKGVDFRTFQFEYQFFPRSSEESRSVLEIIKQFKLHMHPEYKDTNRFVYIYPSEFDITYFTNGQENTSLHKHTSCVLTEMTVNYTPNSQFNSFADGTPTQINMQLTFRELAQMDKELIQGGM